MLTRYIGTMNTMFSILLQINTYEKMFLPLPVKIYSYFEHYSCVTIQVGYMPH